MSHGLANKVALVTGRSTGIGRATAVAFAEEGAKVVIASRDREDAIQTLRLIEKHGGEGIFVQTDVTIARDVENMIDATLATYDRLDCAFNNDGVGGTAKNLIQISDQDFERVIDVNLKGLWLCMKHQIPAMLDSGGGSIVNMASIMGLVGAGGTAAYSASKHGVVGLTKVAALEYARAQIRINLVCPSDSDHTVLLDDFNEVYPEGFNYWPGVNPAGYINHPEAVAKTVVWLCGEDAAFITGAAVPIQQETVSSLSVFENSWVWTRLPIM